MPTNEFSAYLSPVLKQQGYTGVTGTTPYRPATGEQLTTLQEQYAQSFKPSVPLPSASDTVVLSFNFDGTKNNGAFPATGEIPTNVSELYRLQLQANGKENTFYYPGIGAQKLPTGTLDANGNPAVGSWPSSWDSLPVNAGKIGNAIVEQAYDDLKDRVRSILADNPNAEITITMTAFSRGSAEAIAFANLLNERGIPGYSLPGQTFIDHAQLFDPVSMTDGQLNTAWPSNLRNANVFVAMDEYRNIMQAVPVGADANIIALPGAHADLGGGFNPQGISAVSLGIARNAMAAGGTPIAEVPTNLQPGWDQMFVHNSALDNYGNAIWSYNEGARYYEGASIGDSSVQSILRGGAPERPKPGMDLVDEIRVPANPADPEGEQLTMREVVDANGNVIVTVFNASGDLLAAAMPGDRMVRDPDTGRITVSDKEGKVLSEYAPPVINKEIQFAEIDAPALANQFAPGGQANLGGAYGAGQINGFDILPFSESGNFLVNAEGDIVGEFNRLPSGMLQLKDLHGDVLYIDPEAGKILTQTQYDEAQTQAQVAQAAGAVGLMNSIIGLQNWDAMSDLQRTAALVSIYNTVDHLAGNALPGDLGTAASVLGLLNALDQGNAGAALYSGLSLVEHLTFDTAKNMGLVGEKFGGKFLAGLGLVLALESGDPVSIVAAAVNFIPVYGQVLSVVITLLGSLFGNDDIPMKEGQAHAQWDANGNLEVITDQDVEGGGPTANQWVTALSSGLQNELAKHVDEFGNPQYGLIPNLLPSIGFKYDPDGFNYSGSAGHMFLQWTDENGVSQTRYYNGKGDRDDGSGETLAGDFMKHAMDAIAPAWEVQTTLAHWQAGEGLHLPLQKASLPKEAEDGITQTLEVLTLAIEGPALPRASLIDIDGDGYLEKTQWVAANAPMLAIDANGDGYIGAGELINLQDKTAVNSLPWLDANGDQVLDARDPAFAALRLWLDANGDGVSRGETQTMTQAGISAVNFGANPPRIEYADGSTRDLTSQMLAGDVLGAAYRSTQGGLLEISEQADGTGVATLAAFNTRQFDGQAEHRHGGEVKKVDAGDERLTGAPDAIDSLPVQNVTTLAEGDERLQDAGAGTSLTGQTQEGKSAEAKSAKSTGVVFVPTATATGASTDATAAMVRSAEANSADAAWMAMALGAAATAGASAAALAEARGVPIDQWPVWNDAVAIPVAQAPTAPDEAKADGATRQTPAQPQETLSPSAVRPREREVAPSELRTTASAAAPETRAPDIEAHIIPAETPHHGPSTPGAGASPTGGDAATLSVQPESAFMLAPAEFTGERLAGREDAGLRIDAAMLLANDASTGGPALHIVQVDGAAHGTVSLQADGSILFVPDANYHGEAGFRYTVTDAWGRQGSAWATVELEAVNDAPVALGEALTEEEDTALVFIAANLLANDTDVDGDAIRLSRVGQATHGSVELRADGTVRFTPEPDYHGAASFTYWVVDGTGAESPATVQIDLVAVNDLPVVSGEIIESNEDVALRIAPALLLDNDSDVDAATDGQVLSVGAVGGAQHGTVRLLPDGHIEFAPDADYVGTASFNYRVDDGAGGQVWTTARVELAPVNDAPEVAGEVLGMNEDEALRIDAALLLANDADIDSPPADLRIVFVGNATHGNVRLDADGAIHFVPEADYFGTATFTYTVSDGAGGFTVGTASLDIAPVNDAPRLLGESITLGEDTLARFTGAALLANDADPDNDHGSLSIIAVSDAANGAVALVDGEIVFTPTLNYFGPASFTYTVSDGSGGLSQAVVNLQFAPINDAPVVHGEAFSGRRDTAYTFTQAALLANDTDVEDTASLRIVQAQQAMHGQVTLNSDGTITFTPEAGYIGVGSFSYVVEDAGGAQSSATVNVDFSRVNSPPVVVDDSFIGFEDVEFRITASQLLANDSDMDEPRSGLHITALEAATHGTVSLDANGNVSFMPAADYFGQASFKYQVTDSEGASTWATAFMKVQGVNDAPIIEDIFYGLPVYGYEYAYDIDTLNPVFSEARAQELLRAHPEGGGYNNQPGALLDVNGNPLALADFSFYRNGQLRPLYVDKRDVAFDYWDFDPRFPDGEWYDDPNRKVGALVVYDPDGDSSKVTLAVAEGAVHGHVWVNEYIKLVVEGDYVYHTNVASYMQEAPGYWQYVSHPGDLYWGSDPFSILVTDDDGATTAVSIQTDHAGSPISSGGGCPIVIDLKNDGIELLHPEDSNVFMDINADGWRDRIGWAAPADAVLAFDANGDGRVDIDSEVSFVKYLDGARTDLEGLAAFDTDKDGRLTAADTDWSRFGLFQDKNGNGRQDDGEFVSLADAGLSSIGLTREGVPSMNNGNVVFGVSDVQWADGRTSQAGDVMFAGAGIALPDEAAAVIELARMQSLAMQFNQVAAMQDAAPASGAVIFVESGDDPQHMAWLAGHHMPTQVDQTMTLV